MENQIRIITTKRGYENIIRGLRKFNNPKIVNSLINEKTCQFHGRIVFLKWDNPKYYKVVKTIIMILMSHRNSYKICKMENGIVQTYCKEIEYKNLLVPVMRCKFDDEETIKKLNALANRRKKGGQANGI